MAHATDLSPHWAHKPKVRAESLALHGGGVAFVDEGGQVVALDAKGKPGEPISLGASAVAAGGAPGIFQ